MKILMNRRSMLFGSVAMTATLMFEPVAAQGKIESYVLEITEKDGLQVYNGTFPGPTLSIDPGDTLDVKLINNLPALHDDCTDNPNNMHGRNTTNLHPHGLHVSPGLDSSGQFDADNVFVSVVPKNQMVPCAEVCGIEVAKNFRYGENQFRFETHETHPAGTFWYHAHKHGSTAQQVGNGLAGPLIIRDKPGTMPAYIEQAPERVFMITDLGLVQVDEAGGGQIDPTVTLRPGAVERWRVINAQGQGAEFSYFQASLSDLEMHLIAFDGLTLKRRVLIDQENTQEPWLNPAALAPGNRMDIMVRVPPTAGSSRMSLGLVSGFKRLVGLSNMRQVRLDVAIEGQPENAIWSDDDMLPGSGLPDFLDQELPQHTVSFTGGQTVEGEPYDGDTEHKMTLGAEEEWTIENRTQGVHAYHIHVNPFFITHINGEALPENSPLRRWQDTVGTPYANNGPGTVTFKTRFETFKGKFVIHCHVLNHEDRGMMQVVEVV